MIASITVTCLLAGILLFSMGYSLGKSEKNDKAERYEKALKEVLTLSGRTNHSACVEIARRVLEGE